MKKLSFVFLFITILLFFTNSALATKGDNVWGWAWSENIGWISFNNCTDPEGTPDGCSGVDYGVKISKESATQGCLSGYAWSENIGWIHFNEGSLPAELEDQTPKDCLAQIVPNGSKLEIKGWAKAVAGGSTESGGWDGWIKLNGPRTEDNLVPYLSKVDSKTNEFRGYAWGSTVLGWVSYNSQEGGGEAYRVLTSYGLNTPPFVTASEMTWSENHCVGGGNINFYFKWKYYDDEDDPMTKYEFKILENGEQKYYKEVIASAQDGAEVGLSMSAIEAGTKILEYGGTYQWAVKVYNENGESSWITSVNNLILPDYPYPDVADNWSFGSSRFTPGTKVSTVNNAQCYNEEEELVNCTWLWTYEAMDPQKGQIASFYDPVVPEPPAEYLPLDPADIKEPLVFFDKAANYKITLKATDGAGKSCEFSRNVTASTLRYLEPDDPTILDLISKAFDYLQAQAQQTLDWVKSLPLIFN